MGFHPCASFLRPSFQKVLDLNFHKQTRMLSLIYPKFAQPPWERLRAKEMMNWLWDDESEQIIGKLGNFLEAGIV